MEIRKLKVPSVSDIIRNRAVFSSPRVSSSSSSYAVRSLSSLISKGASLAPQETRMDLAVFPETKCQGLFSTPTIHCMKKSHCRFLHNGSKVIFYSLLITGKLVPKLKLNKIAARWPAKAVAQLFTFSKKGSDRIVPR